MSIIDEKHAWEILLEYIEELLWIDAETLIAFFATGSLPGGYYRPGQSDIDAVLIVENGSSNIWGNSEESKNQLAELNRQFLTKYKIPKDFGPFPLQVNELFPPYDPKNDVLALEIARLKIQGKLIYGEFDIGSVPMPTSSDFLLGAQNFEKWWETEFSKTTSFMAMSSTACVNSILLHLSRYLIIEKDVFEFDKRKIVPAYIERDPPVTNSEMMMLVENHIAGCKLSKSEIATLKTYTKKLRLEMNLA